MLTHFNQKLVVAISSRALFDLDASHAVFEREGVDAYCAYQIEWRVASGNKDKSSRHWDITRARAFQRAVEQRTFRLYVKFYADLQCRT